MRIWTLVGHSRYRFDEDRYFNSRKGALSDRAAMVRAGLEPRAIQQADAVTLLEEAQTEIARLRSLVPVEQW